MSKNTIDPKRYSWIDHSWAQIADEYKEKDSTEIAERIMEDLFVAEVDPALSVTSLSSGILQVNTSCKFKITSDYQDRYAIKLKFKVYGSGTSSRVIFARKEEELALPGGCELIEWNVGCLTEHLYNLHNKPYIKSSSFIEEHTTVPTNTNGKGKYEEAAGAFAPLKNVYKTSLYGYRGTSDKVINPGLMMYTRYHDNEGTGVYEYKTNDYTGRTENVINWSTQGVSMIALGGWDESDNGEVSWENESTIKLKTKNKTQRYTVPTYGECMVLCRTPATLRIDDFQIPEDYYPDWITKDLNEKWPYPWLMLVAHDWLWQHNKLNLDCWNLETKQYSAAPAHMEFYGSHWRNAKSYIIDNNGNNDFFKDDPKQASFFFAKKHIDLKYQWKTVRPDAVLDTNSFTKKWDTVSGGVIQHPMHIWFETNYDKVWYKPNDFYKEKEELAPLVDTCIWLGLFPSLSKHAVLDIHLKPHQCEAGLDHANGNPKASIAADAELNYVLDCSPLVVLPHEANKDSSSEWFNTNIRYYCSDIIPANKYQGHEYSQYDDNGATYRFVGSQTLFKSKLIKVPSTFNFDMFAGPTTKTIPWPIANAYYSTAPKPEILHVPWFYGNHKDLDEVWDNPGHLNDFYKNNFNGTIKIKTGMWGIRDLNADMNDPPTYTTLYWRCPFQWNRDPLYCNVNYQSHWINFQANDPQPSYGVYWVDAAIHHWSKQEFIHDFDSDKSLNKYAQQANDVRPSCYKITNIDIFANFSSKVYSTCSANRSSWGSIQLPPHIKEYSLDTDNGLGIGAYDFEGSYPAQEYSPTGGYDRTWRTCNWNVKKDADESTYPVTMDWSVLPQSNTSFELPGYTARCCVWYSRDEKENYHFTFYGKDQPTYKWNKSNIDIMYRPDYDYQSIFIYNWAADDQYLRIKRKSGEAYKATYTQYGSKDNQVKRNEDGTLKVDGTFTENDCLIIPKNDCWVHIKFEDIGHEQIQIINDSEGKKYWMSMTPTYCMLLAEEVHYTSSDPFSEALTFNKKYANLIEVSDDGWNWTPISEQSDNVFFTSPCAPLYLRGKLKDLKTPIKDPLFTAEHNWPLRLGGCLTNLVDYTNPDDTIDAQLPNDVFNLMFHQRKIRHVDQNLLPFTNLSAGCYSSMFHNCASLVNAPTLPATQLAEKCYSDMFFFCTQLSTLPALPANQLPDECYANMFCGCESIKISASRTDEYRNEYSIPAVGNVISVGKDAFVNMWYNTGGTFTGDPATNESYYTSNDII